MYFYPVSYWICAEFHEKVIALWILLLILFSLIKVLVYRNNVYPLPSVLQFVPRNVDVGFCNFSRRIEKGLKMAFMEVSKHQEFCNLTVQVRLARFVSVPSFFSPLVVLCFIQPIKWLRCSLVTSCHLDDGELWDFVMKSGVFFPLQSHMAHIPFVSSFLKNLQIIILHIQKHYWI